MYVSPHLSPAGKRRMCLPTFSPKAEPQACSSVCDSSSLMLRKTPRKKSSFHNLCLTDSQGLLCHTDAILSPQLAQ